MFLGAEGTILFYFLWAILYHATPCSVISFQISVMNLDFVTRHNPVNNFVDFDGVPFHKLSKLFFVDILGSF
jgi:hypothetical protein